MSKMIQLRNVPDELHRKLKVRAAQANLSLSDYLVREAAAVAERPTVEEILERIGKRAVVATSESAADAVRAERDARR
jgi:plasmid stability protein